MLRPRARRTTPPPPMLRPASHAPGPRPTHHNHTLDAPPAQPTLRPAYSETTPRMTQCLVYDSTTPRTTHYPGTSQAEGDRGSAGRRGKGRGQAGSGAPPTCHQWHLSLENRSSDTSFSVSPRAGPSAGSSFHMGLVFSAGATCSSGTAPERRERLQDCSDCDKVGGTCALPGPRLRRKRVRWRVTWRLLATWWLRRE